MVEKKIKKSYFSRFQVKPRRRREGKTDYAKRRKLVRQDASKHGSSKARLVVRVTNSKVIVQVFKAYIQGDRLLAQADSTELKHYGITFGLTNYSACYATGLLCGRRLLDAVNLKDDFEVTEPGTYGVVEDGDVKAFQCFLDIGLARATKGAKVFGAMKGVSDAGVKVPHSPSKFYGFEDGELNEEKMRARIFGKSVSEYMISLRENNPEKYKVQFSKYICLGVEPEKMEEIYKEAFEKIAVDWKSKAVKKDFDYSTFKQFKKQRMTSEEKKQKIEEKLVAIKAGN